MRRSQQQRKTKMAVHDKKFFPFFLASAGVCLSHWEVYKRWHHLDSRVGTILYIFSQLFSPFWLFLLLPCVGYHLVIRPHCSTRIITIAAQQRSRWPSKEEQEVEKMFLKLRYPLVSFSSTPTQPEPPRKKRKREKTKQDFLLKYEQLDFK